MRKKDPKTGLWFFQVSGRHPLTRQPKNLRRKNIENESVAKRVERELEKQMLESFEDQVIPTWRKLVDEYMDYKLLGLEFKDSRRREINIRSAYYGSLGFASD